MLGFSASSASIKLMDTLRNHIAPPLPEALTMRIPIYALLCIAFIGVEYGCKASASAIGQRSSRLQGRDRDSLSVVRYLAQIKCSARMIVKGDRGRFAIVTQDSHTCKPSVLVLTVTRDAVSRVENMRNVDCCYPRSVTWVGLRGVRGHALVIRFDDPVEGELGMYLYGDTGQVGRLSKIYQDGAGACAPAELRTVDGDLALVSYQENPSGEDCESLCHIVIGRRFGMPPSWLQLEVWDGRRWTAAPSHLRRSFYSRLAGTYGAMDTWVREDSAGVPCRSGYWLTNLEVFRKWAKRSDSLASAS